MRNAQKSVFASGFTPMSRASQAVTLCPKFWSGHESRFLLGSHIKGRILETRNFGTIIMLMRKRLDKLCALAPNCFTAASRKTFMKNIQARPATRT